MPVLLSFSFSYQRRKGLTRCDGWWWFRGRRGMSAQRRAACAHCGLFAIFISTGIGGWDQILKTLMLLQAQSRVMRGCDFYYRIYCATVNPCNMRIKIDIASKQIITFPLFCVNTDACKQAYMWQGNASESLKTLIFGQLRFEARLNVDTSMIVIEGDVKEFWFIFVWILALLSNSLYCLPFLFPRGKYVVA